MYPIPRMIFQIAKFRNKPLVELDASHVSHHRCWPIDLDFLMEMNNGRILTLFDLGRIPYFYRTGMYQVMKKQGWNITVAGSTVRYRRRVRVFDRLEMRTRLIGKDARFLYFLQSMWHKGEATSSVLIRAAVTDANGLINPQKLLDETGFGDWEGSLPNWVEGWIVNEADRTWPPEV